MDFASFAKSSAVSSPTWKMPRAVKNLGKVVSFSLMELMIFLADFSPNLSVVPSRLLSNHKYRPHPE